MEIAKCETEKDSLRRRSKKKAFGSDVSSPFPFVVVLVSAKLSDLQQSDGLDELKKKSVGEKQPS